MLHETGTAAIGEMTPIQNTRDRELSTPLATERGLFLLRSNKSREKQEQPNSDEKESPRRIWTDSGVNTEEVQGKLWCCCCTDNMAEMYMCACVRAERRAAHQHTIPSFLCVLQFLTPGASVCFTGEFSPNFDLYKEIFFEKTDPNSPDFYDNFQQVANNIEGFCFYLFRTFISNM
jgi:hypothetical protein